MEVNVMSESNPQNIYEGRPPTPYEIEKMRKRHRTVFYSDMVKEFHDSKKATWAYPVPSDTNWGSYLTGFRKIAYTRYHNISVHGIRNGTSYTIILKREE